VGDSSVAGHSTLTQISSPSISSIIEELKRAEDYRDQIVPGGHLTIPEQIAVFGIFAFAL
jgi:hypothetical protein